MSICSDSQNTPVPSWLTPIGQAGIAVTPAMQQFAAKYAYDSSVPLNTYYAAWFGGQPIAAWVNCHTFTTVGGQNIPGFFHGASLFLITDPSKYPPVPGSPPGTSWGLTAGALLAIAVGTYFATRAVQAA
jgi:hypothetical protein